MKGPRFWMYTGLTGQLLGASTLLAMLAAGSLPWPAQLVVTSALWIWTLVLMVTELGRPRRAR